jgi:hypothetical protein
MLMSSSPTVGLPTTWQERFATILPELERFLRITFRDLTAEAQTDAVENAIVNCLLAYSRLFEQGRAEAATASSLARYAALQTRRGRLACCRMNSKEPLSRYAQLGKGIKVEPLYHRNPDDDGWINDVIDTRQASVADQVAIKLDFVAWLGSLCRRTRCIAVDLARGFSTSEVASKYGLTPGRVSQLRRELQNGWYQFQGEAVPSMAV